MHCFAEILFLKHRLPLSVYFKFVFKKGWFDQAVLEIIFPFFLEHFQYENIYTFKNGYTFETKVQIYLCALLDSYNYKIF